MSTSPASSWSRTRRSCARSVFAPLATLAEHLVGAGGLELPHLSVDALAVRRYPRVAVNHGFILHQTSAPKKANRFKALHIS